MGFVFPHIMQVVGAAEGCHTTSGLVAWGLHPCKLDCSTTVGPKDDSTVTFWRLWALVTVQCMLWGIGTTVGELPPYLVSRAARLSSGQTSDFEEEVEEAKKSRDIISRMKVWTIEFTKRHGFFGVFLLASWPNTAFDMCGMCCGYLLMPFWTFFGATILGKAVVRVNLQVTFFVHLFGSGFFQVMLGGLDTFNQFVQDHVGKDLQLRNLLERTRNQLVLKFEMQSRLAPAKLLAGQDKLSLSSLENLYQRQDNAQEIAARVLRKWDKNRDGFLTLQELQKAASRTDSKVSLSSLDPGVGTSYFAQAWELFILGMVLFFVASVAEQLAKAKQADFDEIEVAAYRQTLMRVGQENKEDMGESEPQSPTSEPQSPTSEPQSPTSD